MRLGFINFFLSRKKPLFADLSCWLGLRPGGWGRPGQAVGE